MEYAFRWALDGLDARVAQRAAGLTGLPALRVFCDEVTAHTGTPFARVAAAGAGPASVLAEVTARWRVRLAARIHEARRAGEIVSPTPDGVLVEQLLALLHGVQALAAPGPGGSGVARVEVVAAFLDGLGVGRSPPQPCGGRPSWRTPARGVSWTGSSRSPTSRSPAPASASPAPTARPWRSC